MSTSKIRSHNLAVNTSVCPTLRWKTCPLPSSLSSTYFFCTSSFLKNSLEKEVLYFPCGLGHRTIHKQLTSRTSSLSETTLLHTHLTSHPEMAYFIRTIHKQVTSHSKMAYLKLLCFFFPLFFTHTFTQTVTLPLQYACSGEYGNYSANSPYRKNLNLLLSSLPTSASYGFYNLSTGEFTSRVNSIILCRGDVTWESCRKCFNDATSILPKLCRYQQEAITWYDDCMLRYSSRTIYGKPETKPYHYIENPNMAPDLNQFRSILGNLMGSLLEEAASGGSQKKFAIGKVNFTESQDIYGLVQCTPDVSMSDCIICLNASIKLFDACCTGQLGGRIFMPSCIVRYELFQFYSSLTGTDGGLLLPRTPVSLPPPTAGVPPGQATDTAKGTQLSVEIINECDLNDKPNI